MYSDDGGQNWICLFFDIKLFGEFYLIMVLGSYFVEFVINVGVVYEIYNDGSSWEVKVMDVVGVVCDLWCSKDGSYVSVSGFGNFYVIWELGDLIWQVYQCVSSQWLQSIGF